MLLSASSSFKIQIQQDFFRSILIQFQNYFIGQFSNPELTMKSMSPSIALSTYIYSYYVMLADTYISYFLQINFFRYSLNFRTSHTQSTKYSTSPRINIIFICDGDIIIIFGIDIFYFILKLTQNWIRNYQVRIYSQLMRFRISPCEQSIHLHAILIINFNDLNQYHDITANECDYPHDIFIRLKFYQCAYSKNLTFVIGQYFCSGKPSQKLMFEPHPQTYESLQAKLCLVPVLISLTFLMGMNYGVQMQVQDSQIPKLKFELFPHTKIPLFEITYEWNEPATIFVIVLLLFMDEGFKRFEDKLFFEEIIPLIIFEIRINKLMRNHFMIIIIQIELIFQIIEKIISKKYRISLLNHILFINQENNNQYTNLINYFIYNQFFKSYTIMTDTDRKNSSRMPFDVEAPKNLNPKFGRNHIFPVIIFSLIVISTILMFFITNISLSVKSQYIISGNAFVNLPAPSNASCTNYYCDQVGTYFLYALDYYLQCNRVNCQLLMCQNYNCSNQNQGNLNQYYMCAQKCGKDSVQNYPSILYSNNVFCIVMLCLLGFGIIISTVCGIYASWNNNLFLRERVSLILNSICPTAKYYYFRERVSWQDVKINFQTLIMVDILMATIWGLMLGTCIYFSVTDVFISYEIITSSLVGLTYFGYLSMISRNRSEFLDFQYHLLKKNYF